MTSYINKVASNKRDTRVSKKTFGVSVMDITHTTHTIILTTGFTCELLAYITEQMLVDCATLSFSDHVHTNAAVQDKKKKSNFCM